MMGYCHGPGALEMSPSRPDSGRQKERRDVPSYIAERVGVDNPRGRLFADLGLCLIAIVIMLAVLRVG